MFHFVRHLVTARRKVTTESRHILTWTKCLFWLSVVLLLTQITVIWSYGHTLLSASPLYNPRSICVFIYSLLFMGPALNYWYWAVSWLFLWPKRRFLDLFLRVGLSSEDSGQTQLGCKPSVVTLQDAHWENEKCILASMLKLPLPTHSMALSFCCCVSKCPQPWDLVLQESYLMWATAVTILKKVSFLCNRLRLSSIFVK